MTFEHIKTATGSVASHRDPWRPTIYATVILLSAPAVAVAQVEPDVTTLEEVIVTATRMGESDLLDTPLSVTALGNEELTKLAISDVRDLVGLAPGLTISQNADFAQIYIRGIGSNNIFAGADPSSTIHYDGVYLARPQAGLYNFLDVERVEVLRGPQGTLYGRNSVGGTINIISRKPSLEETSGAGELWLGNEGFWRVNGYLSGVLAQDTLAGSVSVQLSQHDPYRENVAPTGEDVDDEDIQAFRGQLLWRASETVEVLLRADSYEDDATLYGGTTLLAPPVGNPPLASSILGDFDKVALNAPTVSDREAYGTSLEVNVAIDDRWTLTSLTAYRDHSYRAQADPEATELDLLRTLVWEDQDQFSQEFNLLGGFDRSRLLLGAFYMEEDIDSTIEVQVRTLGISRILAPLVDTDSWAIFGQYEYDLSERFTLTLGGRYTEEEKEWDKSDGIWLTGTDTRLVNLGQPLQVGEYDEFTPKVGLDFRPGDGSLIYGSWSSGFKSGGFNITGATVGGYDPETVDAFEIGWKKRFSAVQLSVAGFYYDYEDLQVQAFIVPGTADITNAASAEIKGAEAELLGEITDAFTVRASIAYLDAEYDEYPEAPISGGGTIDAAGNKLNNAPEWSGSLLAEYRVPLAKGQLRFTGEWRFQSEVFFTTDNNDIERQGSYDVGNLSAGYLTESGRYEFAVWARNVTDEEYITGAGTIVNPSGQAGPPLTYGIQATARF